MLKSIAQIHTKIWQLLQHCISAEPLIQKKQTLFSLQSTAETRVASLIILPKNSMAMKHKTPIPVTHSRLKEKADNTEWTHTRVTTCR